MKNAFFAAAACLLLVFCCSAGHVHSAAESVGGWGDCGLKHAEEAPVADDGGGLCGGGADATVLDDLLLAGRGCCSWHGGMSGECYNGRVVCNDGTLSPSCTCRASTTPAAQGA